MRGFSKTVPAAVFVLGGLWALPAARADYNVGAGQSLHLSSSYNGNVNVGTGASFTLDQGAVLRGNVQAGSGATVSVLGATVNGNVQTNGSASLTLTSATVQGNVQPQNTATVTITGGSVNGNIEPQGCGTVSIGCACASSPVVCTSVQGNLQVQHSAGPVHITGAAVHGNTQVQQIAGPTSVVGCTIGGNLEVQNNAGAVTCTSNGVNGNIQVQNNSGGTTVSGNGDKQLQCQNNAAPVTCTAGVASGPVSLCPGPPTSCSAILAMSPGAPSGVYTIQPKGQPSAFPVYCDMQTAGGGWTLAAQEVANSLSVEQPNYCAGAPLSQNGALQFLGVDSGNATQIAQGTASGIIGDRFGGAYSDVRIAWASGSFIQFSISGFDIFSNTVNLAAPVTHFSSSDPTLSGWVASAGGALFCDASSFPNVRPGDTGWAVTPATDLNRGCGCDSGGWFGQGAYYGGTADQYPGNPAPTQTECCGFGGGWAGVQDLGQTKGGFTPAFTLQIWIRD